MRTTDGKGVVLGLSSSVRLDDPKETTNLIMYRQREKNEQQNVDRKDPISLFVR